MIESLQNEKVKYYTKLNEKKYREETGLFIACGQHLVEEAIKHNIIKEIFLLKGEENIYGEVTYVTKEILKKVSNLDNSPKVLAICNKLESKNISGNIVILDDISDPGNLGTIIRSAVAFNYQTIILSPETVDMYNQKVIRASEGMIFNVNIIIADLKSQIEKLKQEGYFIYGTSVDGKNNNLTSKDKHALIIGSEASGVKPEVFELCDELISIKMNPLCESLNAGVAASILMHELNK